MSNNSDPFDYSAFTGASGRASVPPPGLGGPVTPGSSIPGDWVITSPAEVASTKASGPPVGWIVAGLVCAALAVVLSIVLGTNPIMAASAWVLGGPVAIGLLALFTLHDTAQRVDLFYSSGIWSPWLYRVTIALVAVATIASALHLAFWVGRQ